MKSTKKTVLVTGCSSGFGRLTVQALLARGHRVFAGVRARGPGDEALGPDLIELDVSRDRSVDEAFRAIAASTTSLDAVVNNAGVSAMGVAEGFSAAQLLALLEVNVVGAHRVDRGALPLMKPRREGLLAHVSTGLARMPMPCFGPYAASKAALEALVETYRYELAPLGIEAMLFEPGAYPTSLGANALAPEDVERVGTYGPLADLPKRMMEGLAGLFASPNAPDVHDVPNAIVAAIEAEPGTRPLRVVVGGMGSAVSELNALTDRLQAETLRAQGLEALLRRTP